MAATNVLPKVIVGVALALLMIIVIFCPCDRFLCCHLKEFWGLWAAVGVAVMAANGFSLGCPK